MRMLAVGKRVPDSRAAIKVRPDGSGIETGGLKFVCDPFDEFGVAEAVLLAGQRSDVEEVAVIAAGPAETALLVLLSAAARARRIPAGTRRGGHGAAPSSS